MTANTATWLNQTKLFFKGSKQGYFPILRKACLLYYFKAALTLSWQRPLSYRNQSTDLLRKSMAWFLYDIGLRNERVKKAGILFKRNNVLRNEDERY